MNTNVNWKLHKVNMQEFKELKQLKLLFYTQSGKATREQLVLIKDKKGNFSYVPFTVEMAQSKNPYHYVYKLNGKYLGYVYKSLESIYFVDRINTHPALSFYWTTDGQFKVTNESQKIMNQILCAEMIKVKQGEI